MTNDSDIKVDHFGQSVMQPPEQLICCPELDDSFDAFLSQAMDNYEAAVQKY